MVIQQLINCDLLLRAKPFQVLSYAVRFFSLLNNSYSKILHAYINITVSGLELTGHRGCLPNSKSQINLFNGISFEFLSVW